MSCLYQLLYWTNSNKGHQTLLILVALLDQNRQPQPFTCQHINTFSVYDLTFHPFPFYLLNCILLNTSNLQTKLLCHCVMFICVICHVTWAMWPIELVFIINTYLLFSIIIIIIIIIIFVYLYYHYYYYRIIIILTIIISIIITVLS